MNDHLLLRLLGVFLLAGPGALAFGQDEENTSPERKVRIEITKSENGKSTHVSREFDLSDESQLQDALRELGVFEEMNMIGDGENLVLDLKRMRDGGQLNDMCVALTMPGAEEEGEAKPYLGVYYGDWISKDTRNKDKAAVKEGAYVTGVDDDTPAQKAGLQSGDVIVAMGDHKVANGEDLVDAINDHKPGEKVKLTYYRGKDKKTADVVLASKRSETTTWNWNGSGNSSEGMDWQAYADGNWGHEESAFLGVDGERAENGKGVLLTNVVSGSAAEKMGLKEGDVITSFNENGLEDFDELASMIADMKPEDAVKIMIRRDGKTMTLNGQLGKREGDTWNMEGMEPMEPMPPMAPVPDMNGMVTPEAREQYEQDMAEFQRDMEEHARDMAEQARDAAQQARDEQDQARDMVEHGRDQREFQRDMAELRSQMDQLRRELRGDVTREVRVNINPIELSPEEKVMLQGKGVQHFDQPLELNDLRCYPNPSDGTFHLMFQVLEKGDLNVDMHDASGERVYHESITGFKGRYERVIDVSDKPSGTYFVVLTQNGHTTSSKLVKK